MSFESLTLENYGLILENCGTDSEDSDEDHCYGEKWWVFSIGYNLSCCPRRSGANYVIFWSLNRLRLAAKLPIKRSNSSRTDPLTFKCFPPLATIRPLLVKVSTRDSRTKTNEMKFKIGNMIRQTMGSLSVRIATSEQFNIIIERGFRIHEAPTDALNGCELTFVSRTRRKLKAPFPIDFSV
jgi:hypothetical protein